MSSPRTGDPPGRGRGALDLGDEVEPRRDEAFDDPARRGCAGRGPRKRAGARCGKRLEVRSSPRRDLLDDVRGPDLRSRARLRGRPGGRRSDGRGHAVTPGRFGRATLRAEALEQLEAEARRRWSGRPARSPPPSIRRASATSSAAAGVEDDDVSASAGLTAEHRLDHPGVLVGRPAGEPGRRRRRLKPSFDAGISCRSTPAGLT